MLYEEEHSECNPQFTRRKNVGHKDAECRNNSIVSKKKKNHVLIVIKELLKMNPMGKLLLYEEKHSQLDTSIGTMGSHGISSRPWRSIQISPLI